MNFMFEWVRVGRDCSCRENIKFSHIFELTGNALFIILLVFGVTPCKIDQNKSQNRSIDKVHNLEKKQSKYAKTLAKIQVAAIFLTQDMRRYFFTQSYKDLYGDAMQAAKPARRKGRAFFSRPILLTSSRLRLPHLCPR